MLCYVIYVALFVTEVYSIIVCVAVCHTVCFKGFLTKFTFFLSHIYNDFSTLWHTVTMHS